MNIRRRPFVAAGVAWLTVPATVFAQVPEKVWRIGFLSSQSGPSQNSDAFRDQLRILGYTEGRNLSIEYRWAAGADERLPEMAAELVRLKVDIIVTHDGLPSSPWNTESASKITARHLTRKAVATCGNHPSRRSDMTWRVSGCSMR